MSRVIRKSAYKRTHIIFISFTFISKEADGVETKRDFIWKMGGQQGQGVESCGEILGRVLAQEGYSLFSQRLFASRIKGGHTTIALRIATKEVATIGEHVDCLVALTRRLSTFTVMKFRRAALSSLMTHSTRNLTHIPDVFSWRFQSRSWQESTAACR